MAGFHCTCDKKGTMSNAISLYADDIRGAILPPTLSSLENPLKNVDMNDQIVTNDYDI